MNMTCLLRNIPPLPSPSPSPNFTSIISKSTTLGHLTQILSRIVVSGLENHLIPATKLCHKLSSLGAISQAQLLFSSIPQPDLFLFNVLIQSFSHNNSPSSAISLYSHLRCSTSLIPDTFSFAFAISASSSLSSDGVGRLLHAHCIIDGFGHDRFVASAIADFYLKFSQVGVAEKVFWSISDPDVVCWNTMISGLVGNCRFQEALVFFKKMVLGGMHVDSTTLAAILPVMAELQDLRMGMMVHCLAVKRGLYHQAFVITGLISMYSKCGEVEFARILFGQTGEVDLIASNAMISGYSSNGDVEAALNLFKELLIVGEKVNASTLVSLIPVFSPFGHMYLCQSIHVFSVKSGIDSNSNVSTALTTVYARLNDMESARQVFDQMQQKTLASWNAMISGYTQNGFTDMAISLFRQMQMWDVRPNPVTVTSILSACAQLGAISLGKWVHDLIIRERIESNVYVLTSLIDMYAKCGSIAEARGIFDEMSDKNVVSWNVMISGYGLHGKGPEALKLFADMSNAGIIPTGVTFLLVLHACSHTGLVGEGCEIYQSMIHDYKVEPGPEHYACMVDLLGRAGKLDKAVAFIKALPVEPGPGVWGALLGACMKYKDTNLARIASKRLFDLDPENAGYYVLLSNIYSADQNYPEAAVIRQMALRRNLAKTPGCTLIEVDETLHVFTSGDRSHIRSDEIYAMLEKLTGKMAEAGFRSEINSALYDVEEEEKENMVKVHSEKLAIAFGLISTEPGSEIRIIKNLRVCLDCHNATKFISKVTERVIVVRDANRFHHFRDGVCSCGDYW